jgi:hypothetical protein
MQKLFENENLCVRTTFKIQRFEKLETDEERWKTAKEVYDQFIMRELLASSHVNTVSVSNSLSVKIRNMRTKIV